MLPVNYISCSAEDEKHVVKEAIKFQNSIFMFNLFVILESVCCKNVPPNGLGF